MRNCHRRGAALVMVLWVFTVAFAVALQLSLVSRLGVQLTRNTGQGVQALMLARAGVEQAIAELTNDLDSASEQGGLRSAWAEDADHIYSNVELGDGTYTLLAGLDELGEARYGLADECGLLNVNSAEQEVLARVPGLDGRTAAAIVAVRGEDGFARISDLMQVPGIDDAMLYGEDRNQNGLLDPNEDDGDDSWPGDDLDGQLDLGLAGYLTCHSRVRNVDRMGEKRLDLNSADKDDLQKKLGELSELQIQSIIQHRKNAEFESVADLLEVKLVQTREEDDEEDGAEDDNRTGTRSRNRAGRADGGRQRRVNDSSDANDEGGTDYEQTDEPAFDASTLKQIADRVSATSDEVLAGRLNVNTAPAEVLACLEGLDAPLAGAIVAERQSAPFESVAHLLDVTGMGQDAFKKVCTAVCVRSDVYRVRSFGVIQSANGRYETHRCVVAIVDRAEDETEIVSWQETR